MVETQFISQTFAQNPQAQTAPPQKPALPSQAQQQLMRTEAENANLGMLKVPEQLHRKHLNSNTLKPTQARNSQREPNKLRRYETWQEKFSEAVPQCGCSVRSVCSTHGLPEDKEDDDVKKFFFENNKIKRRVPSVDPSVLDSGLGRRYYGELLSGLFGFLLYLIAIYSWRIQSTFEYLTAYYLFTFSYVLLESFFFAELPKEIRAARKMVYEEFLQYLDVLKGARPVLQRRLVPAEQPGRCCTRLCASPPADYVEELSYSQLTDLSQRAALRKILTQQQAFRVVQLFEWDCQDEITQIEWDNPVNLRTVQAQLEGQGRLSTIVDCSHLPELRQNLAIIIPYDSWAYSYFFYFVLVIFGLSYPYRLFLIKAVSVFNLRIHKVSISLKCRLPF